MNATKFLFGLSGATIFLKCSEKLTAKNVFAIDDDKTALLGWMGDQLMLVHSVCRKYCLNCDIILVWFRPQNNVAALGIQSRFRDRQTAAKLIGSLGLSPPGVAQHPHGDVNFDAIRRRW
jgi:hypothetical protein